MTRLEPRLKTNHTDGQQRQGGRGGVEGGGGWGVLAWVGGCIKVEIQGERSPGYICVCVCVLICSLSALRNLFLYTVSHSLMFCDFFKYPPLDWTN